MNRNLICFYPCGVAFRSCSNLRTRWRLVGYFCYSCMGSNCPIALLSVCIPILDHYQFGLEEKIVETILLLPSEIIHTMDASFIYNHLVPAFDQVNSDPISELAVKFLNIFFTWAHHLSCLYLTPNRNGQISVSSFAALFPSFSHQSLTFTISCIQRIPVCMVSTRFRHLIFTECDWLWLSQL